MPLLLISLYGIYQSVYFPIQPLSVGDPSHPCHISTISQDRPQIPNHLILLLKLQQLICKSSTLEIIENFMKHCADQTTSEV